MQDNDYFVKKMATLAGLFIFIAAVFLYAVLSPISNFPSGRVFTIDDGESVREISSELRLGGYVRSRSLFNLVVILQGKSTDLKSGDYIFEKPLSLFEISRRISSGLFGINRVRVTIPEGYNLREIGFLFENLGMFQAEEVWELAGFPGADYSKNSDLPVPKDFSSASALVSEKPKDAGLEGYFFPDTYFFLPGDSAEKVIVKILKNFEERMTSDIRAEATKQNFSLHEILTMASLLEEEASNKEDRAVISGIIRRRLLAEMPLQIDAALSYITGRSSLELTSEDLKLDSRYNTYLYKGLPLGPISNPGIEAIEAALNPTESPYWFYLSDSENKIHYAETFEEHKLNKERYLR